MTREEAIEILKTYKEESEEDYWVMRAKALGMAISALSADARPHRHARWVEVNGKLLCSCCSQGNTTNYKYPFCHWCGADMRGE